MATSQLFVTAQASSALQEARSFNNAFDHRLQLVRNDCRSHSAALVKHLTGVSVTLSTGRVSQTV